MPGLLMPSGKPRATSIPAVKTPGVGTILGLTPAKKRATIRSARLKEMLSKREKRQAT